MIELAGKPNGPKHQENTLWRDDHVFRQWGRTESLRTVRESAGVHFAWPKTIFCGQSGSSLERILKTHFDDAHTQRLFGQARKRTEMFRWPVRVRFCARSADATHNAGNYQMNFDVSAAISLRKSLAWPFAVSERLPSNRSPGAREEHFCPARKFD